MKASWSIWIAHGDTLGRYTLFEAQLVERENTFATKEEAEEYLSVHKAPHVRYAIIQTY